MGLSVQRKSRPQFRFSHRLVHAIKRSSDTLTALGTICQITQPQLSRYCAGQTFTAAINPRVFALAAHLGVSPDRAVVKAVSR